ncbi:hypothetical protein BSLG_001118 [Batrachochytrium salamandrivorans]|nr:hypothetical protein BSLG_001118 [Batrachochytrium salamandrivorans]
MLLPNSNTNGSAVASMASASLDSNNSVDPFATNRGSSSQTRVQDDHTQIWTLLARQSSTLSKLRPAIKSSWKISPNGYAGWFKTAQEKKCLIDDYELIWDDMAPAINSGDEFRRRMNVLQRNAPKALSSNIQKRRYWMRNQSGSMSGTDHLKLMKEECHIHDPNRPLEQVHETHGYFQSPMSTLYSRKLLPILSHTRISNCFRDIIVPSIYYYSLYAGGPSECDFQDCADMRKELDISASEPFETVYNYKYAMDIVRRDLEEKITWARNNDAEARRIAESGRRFSERILNKPPDGVLHRIVIA